MAVSKDTIKTSYPLPVYNYRVTILSSGGLGGDQSVISCSEVQGLKMEVETVAYQDGLSFLSGEQVLPGRRQGVRLSIRKGVTRSGKFLSDWMGSVYPLLRSTDPQQPLKRDILIDLCDEAGQALIRWMVGGAMPVSLLAPTFSADSNETAVEQLELVAHELSVEYLNA